jgi:signal transduction histidine kinase
MGERNEHDNAGMLSERVLAELERIARSLTGTLLLAIAAVVLAVAVAYDDTLRLELLALFAAVAYLSGTIPGRRGAAFAVIMPTTYLMASLQMSTRDVGDAIVGTAAIGAAALAGNVTTRVNRRNAARFERAAALAERRAQLLEVAALAGRSIQQVSTRDVLRNLVIASTGLGWEAAALYLLDHERGTARCDYAIGLPDVQGTVRAYDRGVIGDVVAHGQMVAVDYLDYAGAVPAIKGLGFRATIATPIVVEGELAAVLTVASRRRSEVTADEKETLRMIASHAGSAMRIARMYATEHEARERLERLDRLQDDFIATASHELRTPLTIVKGASEILDTRWDDADEGTKRLLAQRISSHANEMARLVDRLLQFHQLDADGAATLRRPVAIAPLVDNAVHVVAEHAADKIVNWRIPPDLVVEGDPEHLRWAITALIDNAVRHTPAGTIVTVEAHRTDDVTVELSVADDGRGIPEDVLQAEAGARFRRGGDVLTRDTRGIGLGLPTVRRVARRHGSELQIQSDPGHGTRVAMRLPAYLRAAEGDVRTIVLDEPAPEAEHDRPTDPSTMTAPQRRG